MRQGSSGQEAAADRGSTRCSSSGATPMELDLVVLDQRLQRLAEMTIAASVVPAGLLGPVRWKRNGTGEVQSPWLTGRQPTEKASTRPRRRGKLRGRMAKVVELLHALGLA